MQQQHCSRVGLQMLAKRKAEVILTKEDGTQLVYHSNRRDALYQMLLGVGVLSTDRYAVVLHHQGRYSRGACLLRTRSCCSIFLCLVWQQCAASIACSVDIGRYLSKHSRCTISGCSQLIPLMPPTLVSTACSLRWMWAPNTAGAALMQFPTASLRNKYFLVRVTSFHKMQRTLRAYVLPI